MTSARERPRKDLHLSERATASIGLVGVLVLAAFTLEIESVLWVVAGLSAAAALTPLASRKHLLLSKFLSSIAASVAGTLLVFLATFSLGVAIDTGRELDNSEGGWIGFCLICALVGVFATAVAVAREQARERYREWSLKRDLAGLTQAVNAHAEAVERKRRLEPVAWVAAGVAVVLAWRRAGTR